MYLTFARFPSSAAHSVNILKMCQSIKKKGCDLTLVADFRKNREDLFSIYSIKHTFALKSIKLSNIRFLGRIFFLIKAFFVVKKKIPHFFFTRDIFHTFFLRIFKKPIIFEVHEYPSSLIRKFITKKILKSPQLQRVVFISEKLKNLYLTQFPETQLSERWLVAHDGVDVENFQLSLSPSKARKSLHLPENACIAGYSGSLFEGRGGEVILQTAQNLKEVFFLVVGGEGKYLNSFKEKVNFLHLQNLRVEGYVPHSKIPLYLKACNILLMPYQHKVLHRQKKHDTAFYMSPLKMFEYMASGKPIVASHLPVIEEVLQHRRNALLVTPDETEAWIRAILELKKNIHWAENMGKQAQKDVQKYTWDKRAHIIFSKTREGP